ncbi:beta-lactamase/transpeptidase-like protein [Trichoderma citrinoviride]|uniref:Beta-lactamase/transpeptidase-like protein n=1 Tax=Trichoderma citrinoviride TaxID=58853 RepID=A0A2T4B107_9HYPO|nr:beta-lactamase/transpeptidase-like protein [Trichoderma citrinoviride]PTB63005.1 beta-lactamase/transpeptidase-like protein [Trichoderma citrinoviride]
MEKIDALLRGAVAERDDTACKDKLLGAAFVVTNRDGVIYSGSAGRIDFAADSPDFNGDTLTYGASLTKLLAATCLMQLVEQGKMQLDSDVRQIVPEVRDMQILRGFTSEGKPILEDNERPITLKHLMLHTAGLRYDVADPNLRRWSEYIGRPLGKTIRLSKDGYNTPLLMRPGDGWMYGPAMDWAGVALETVTGQRLGEYMKQHLLDPLGMRDTGFRVNGLPHTAGRRAQVTLRDDDAGSLSAFDVAPVEPELDSAGAGIHTTAHDYARMLRAMLQLQLQNPPSLPLSGRTAREMFAPQLDERQRAVLQEFLYDAPDRRRAFIPEFPDGVALQYGFGGLLALGELEGQRRAGSLSWTGAGNSRWTGIAGVLMTAVFPLGDAVACRLYTELERAVYAELVK